MSNNEEVINYTIKPHGGELINRVLEGEEREHLIKSFILQVNHVKSMEYIRFRVDRYRWI